MFSVAMLKKSISKIQWLALFMLFLGVSVVQLQPVDGPVAQSPEESIPTISPLSQTQNPLLGLAAVVASSLCSGYAGKLVKKVFAFYWQYSYNQQTLHSSNPKKLTLILQCTKKYSMKQSL